MCIVRIVQISRCNLFNKICFNIACDGTGFSGSQVIALHCIADGTFIRISTRVSIIKIFSAQCIRSGTLGDSGFLSGFCIIHINRVQCKSAMSTRRFTDNIIFILSAVAGRCGFAQLLGRNIIPVACRVAGRIFTQPIYEKSGILPSDICRSFKLLALQEICVKAPAVYV